MHERSLAAALVRQVEAIRQRNAAERVVAIEITLGEFAGVDLDLIQSALAELSLSTSSEGAEIKIDRVPLECTCLECGGSTLVKDFCFECRHCQSRRVEITRGEEMILESVTLAGAD